MIRNVNMMIKVMEKKFGIEHDDLMEKHSNVWVKKFSATVQAHYGIFFRYAGIREKAHVRLVFEKSSGVLLKWSCYYENGVALYNDSKKEIMYCNGDIGLINIGGVGPKIASRHAKFFANILQELQERMEDEQDNPTEPREGRTAEYLEKTSALAY